jgi:hypothetical protein
MPEFEEKDTEKFKNEAIMVKFLQKQPFVR